MIPKVIHYCWFGRGKKPALAEKCIASWRKYLPDFEIKEWNEDNYDVNSIPYTAEAYAAKKYAFVSDYARFDILYRFGGIYFDTDVEVIRPIDDILAAGPFMGCECGARIAPGLGGAAEKGMPVYEEILKDYRSRHFLKGDGSFNLTTVVDTATRIISAHTNKLNAGMVSRAAEINIYPQDYFCPKNPETFKLVVTKNTRTIHHYSGSWHTFQEELVFWTCRHFGRKAAMLVALVQHNPVYIVKRIRKYWRTGE